MLRPGSWAVPRSAPETTPTLAPPPKQRRPSLRSGSRADPCRAQKLGWRGSSLCGEEFPCLVGALLGT